MKQFTYTIREPKGMKILSASELASQSKVYNDTDVTITKDGVTVRVSKLLKLLALKLKMGDTITLSCDGPNEENAYEVMGLFLCDNL